MSLSALGGGAMVKVVELFNPDTAPCRGMHSSMTPSALGAGEFTMLKNLRVGQGTLKVRDCALRALEYPSTGIPSGAEFRGGILDHSADLVALKEGSVVKVFQLASGSWSEVTDATTRFSGDGKVEFTIFREPVYADLAPFGEGQGEWVVWQNGVERPRIKSRLFSGAPAAMIEPIAAPEPTSTQAKPVAHAFIPIADRDSGDLATSDSSKIAVSVTDFEGYGNCVQLDFSTSVTNGSFARLSFADMPVEFSGVLPQQLQLVYSCSDPSIWELCELWLKDDSGAWFRLHGASSFDPIFGTSLGTYAAVGFSVSSVRDELDAAVSLDAAGTFEELEVRFVGGSTSTPISLSLLGGIFGTGVPANSTIGVSFFCANSRVESPGTIAETMPPPTLREAGGTPIPLARFAEEAGFTYRYIVSTTKPTGLPSGTNYLLTYVGLGDSCYLSDSQQLNLTSTTSLQRAIKVLDHDRVIDRLMPGALHVCLPTGSAMATAGGRLFVGNARQHSSQAANGDVWFSEAGYPSRFTRTVRFSEGVLDPRSGGSVTLNQEPIHAMHAVSGSLLGAESVLVWTNVACYSLDGSDALQLGSARIVSPHGTLSPWSVSSYRNSVVWLDQDRQMQSLGSSLNLVGKRVDDAFLELTDAEVADVSSCTFRDRIYFGFAGQKCLVFDTHSGTWVQDELESTVNFAKFAPTQSGIGRRFMCFSDDGTLFEYEVAGTADEFGEHPMVEIRSRELTLRFWNRFSLRRVGVVMDDADLTTPLSTQRIGRQGETVAGELDLSSSSQIVWRWDHMPGLSGAPVALADVGIQVGVSGALPGGTQIYSLVAELQDAHAQGALTR